MNDLLGVVGAIGTIELGVQGARRIAAFFDRRRAPDLTTPLFNAVDYSREIDLRMQFEIRYWLLMKKTGKAVSQGEAKAWLFDQDGNPNRLQEMHAVLLPEGYQPRMASWRVADDE